jgi:ribosomal protein L18E
MAASPNKEWNLESFIDSLVVELDKAREVLAVKAINRPLTYTVKDVGLDLNLFPTYDGDEVRFVTAKPGQTGASKLSIQLGSITDQQIRLTSKEPITKDNISIESIDIDPETRKGLRKMGISSVNDLEKIEKKNVDLEKVSNKKMNYKNLADIINKSKRGNLPPSVSKVSLSMAEENPVLIVEGKNLHVDENFPPVAVVNDKLASIVTSDSNQLRIKMDPKVMRHGKNELVMTLDPYAIFKLEINN